MTCSPSNDRAAALLAFLPALASVFIIVHHPVLDHSDERSGAALVAGIGRIWAANAAFHGILLLLVSAQALGIYHFAERLGLWRLWARAGVLFYGLALVLMFIPAILDGFVTPLLGVRCASDPSVCGPSLVGSLNFEWAAIQGFTRAALALQSLSLLCWSMTLAFTSGWRRWAGIGGALVAGMPLVWLATVTAALNPSNLQGMIAAEALWAMAAGVMMWNRLLPPVAARGPLSIPGR